MTHPPHPNTGSSGVLRGVIQVLEGHPQGLTTAQILDLAIARGTLEVHSEEGPKTPYFRVKRALDSLLKLGFVRHDGFKALEGRAQKTFVVVPQAMDEALRTVLRLALGTIEDRIRNQFPLSDSAQLVAAFEEVLEEDAERLGLVSRKPKLGKRGLELRKSKDPGPRGT